ncbi:MAG: NYN domain-containing protein [bacterium]
MKFSKFCDITKKYPNEKVQVFIDQANLYKVLKRKYENYQVNYKKLALRLLGGRKLIRINIYVSTLNPEYEPEPSKSQHAWISFLQSTDSVTVKTRPLRYTPNKQRDREKGIDILLATDMLQQAYVDGYDTMILISGDGDYAPVLEEIKKMGKRVENAFLKESRSNALRSVCDVFIDLDKNVLSDCLIKKAGPRN